MKKRWLCVLLCLALTAAVMISGCAQEEQQAPDGQILGALMMDSLPGYTLEDHESKASEDGSMEFYAVIVFEEEHVYEFENRIMSWQRTPVSTTYRNLTDYLTILPEATIRRASESLTKVNEEDARWMFFDRTAEFKKKYKQQIKDAAGQNTLIGETGESQSPAGTDGSSLKLDPSGIDPRTPDYAVGFSCAFYVPSKHKLYLYEYSPAFDPSLLKYVR